LVDIQERVNINGFDASECIDWSSWNWTCIAMSAESATGQDIDGTMHVPVLGERIQLQFNAPALLSKSKLFDLVSALEMGSTGQRDISIAYDDPLFGQTGDMQFYCTNIQWLKLIDLNDNLWAKNVSFQLASTRYRNMPVASDSMPQPYQAQSFDHQIWINGQEFSDCISFDGYSGQYIEQSLESQTGQTLDGRFHIPIIGGRSQLNIAAPTLIRIPRFRQLATALGFGTTGERSCNITYVDYVKGQVTVPYYCTQLSGTRIKDLNDEHWLKDVKFQIAMKRFF